MKEIAQKLSVAQSTSSLWVRDVQLHERAMVRLKGRVSHGQLASARAKRLRSDAISAELRSDSVSFISRATLSSDARRILCAFLYWCEGGKAYRGGIAFTNSDPALTRLFLDLMVQEFHADRLRFICRLHLHEYHDERSQVRFWSQALQLPEKQFRKTYWKPHTGIRIREGYPGCISLRIYDSILARKVMYVAQEYLAKHGGIG